MTLIVISHRNYDVRVSPGAICMRLLGILHVAYSICLLFQYAMYVIYPLLMFGVEDHRNVCEVWRQYVLYSFVAFYCEVFAFFDKFAIRNPFFLIPRAPSPIEMRQGNRTIDELVKQMAQLCRYDRRDF